MRGVRICAAGAMLLAAAFGCDLLKDATTFTFATDWQSFTVDSASLGVVIPSGSVVPAVACTTTNDVCAQATAQLKCGGGSYACKVQCGSSAKCEIVGSAEVFTTVDLSNNQEIKKNGAVLSKVSVRDVLFRVDEDTLNFDTPKIELYLGPASATKTNDAGVVPFATMDPILKKTASGTSGKITPTAAGNDTLAGYIQSYQTPFRILGKATLRFATGDSIPQGKLSLSVKALVDIQPLK
jgi:hypothetical protein